MSAQHTPGRLVVRGDYGIYTADGVTPVADTCLTNSVSANDAANARRLVACWNMLEGETTENIEANPLPAILDNLETLLQTIGKNFLKVTEQRDELLEALKLADAALSDIGDADREPGDDLAWCEARAAKDIPAIRAAIAKAEGGAA
jgi:hypothetical protein